PLTHQWVASGQPRAVGYPTSPNIPTEEVFTLPLRDGVNGTVQSTKPLSHAGQLIEDIAVTFQDGRIVSYTASRGLDALREVIETDEGSHFLGEVALVPVDSPISRSGILYYNTLFDENASCHLAIGAAYPTTLTDGGEVEGDADLLKRGANASMTHVDFMIGSADLSIDATTTDGRTVPVFRYGNWAQSL
ncbi:MAG: aminopeptidase, partial [Sulfobacillus sp.]